MKSADYKLSYLSDERPTCPLCGEPSDDIEERPDPFVVGGIWETSGPRQMTSCRRCYDERRMEI